MKKGRSVECVKKRNDKKLRTKVRVVSPYFANLKVGEEIKVGKDSSNASKNCLNGRKVSPYFQNAYREKKKSTIGSKRQKPCLSASQKRDEAYLRRSEDNMWVPPRSHFNLLQENHAHDPWRVLVICMLLNCTTGVQESGRRVFHSVSKCCGSNRGCCRGYRKVAATFRIIYKEVTVYSASLSRISWKKLDSCHTAAWYWQVCS